MIVKIGGVEVDYEFGSIDIDNAINERSTATFTIMDRAGSNRFYKGQPVEIYSENGPQVPAAWADEELTSSWEMGV